MVPASETMINSLFITPPKNIWKPLTFLVQPAKKQYCIQGQCTLLELTCGCALGDRRCSQATGGDWLGNLDIRRRLRDGLSDLFIELFCMPGPLLLLLGPPLPLAFEYCELLLLKRSRLLLILLRWLPSEWIERESISREEFGSMWWYCNRQTCKGG